MAAYHDDPDRSFLDDPEPFDEAGENRRKPGIRVGAWLWQVFFWDGVLPVVVLWIPQFARNLQADRDVVEGLAIVLPILAFFVRLAIGYRKLARNHCGPLLKTLQFGVFFMAAILLVCVDSLMILAMEMNAGAQGLTPEYMLVFSGLFAIYFLAMLFVFYPGRRPPNHSTAE